jgi:hypothetical protein
VDEEGYDATPRVDAAQAAPIGLRRDKKPPPLVIDSSGYSASASVARIITNSPNPSFDQANDK